MTEGVALLVQRADGRGLQGPRAHEVRGLRHDPPHRLALLPFEGREARELRVPLLGTPLVDYFFVSSPAMTSDKCRLKSAGFSSIG